MEFSRLILLVFCFILILFLFAMSLHFQKTMNNLKEDLVFTKSQLDIKSKEFSNLVDKHNLVVREHNKKYRRIKELESDMKNSNFTDSDIKRMKHYLHPDKHNGKTNDLFIKVSGVIKN